MVNHHSPWILWWMVNRGERSFAGPWWICHGELLHNFLDIDPFLMIFMPSESYHSQLSNGIKIIKNGSILRKLWSNSPWQIHHGPAKILSPRFTIHHGIHGEWWSTMVNAHFTMVNSPSMDIPTSTLLACQSHEWCFLSPVTPYTLGWIPWTSRRRRPGWGWTSTPKGSTQTQTHTHTTENTVGRMSRVGKNLNHFVTSKTPERR